MKNQLILFALIVTLSFQGLSQNKAGASIGMGIPELINVGVRYELQPPIKLGMSIGTAFTGAPVLSGDIYFHFAGRSKWSEVPPWYLRTNLTYGKLGKIFFIDAGQIVLLGFRAGRDFNVTENFGVSVDGGIMPISFFSGKRIPFSFIPSLSISIYKRWSVGGARK